MEQVRAGHAHDQRRRRKLDRSLERTDRCRVEQHASLEPGGPGDGGPEHLLRFGAVRDRCLQRVDRQADRRVDELVALVGVGQVAEPLIHRRLEAARQQIADPVQDVEPDRVGPVVGHGRRPHEPEVVGRLPSVDDGQAERGVMLLEQHGVAHHGLGDGALDPSVGRGGERPPQLAVDADPGHRARRSRRRVQAVVRHVREERSAGVTPAGGERSARRDEHPPVAVADHAHQERRHAVDVDDPVVQLAVDLDEPLRHGAACGGPAIIEHGHRGASSSVRVGLGSGAGSMSIVCGLRRS